MGGDRRDEDYTYVLFSVLVHAGGVHGGHYYAFIRPTQQVPAPTDRTAGGRGQRGATPSPSSDRADLKGRGGREDGSACGKDLKAAIKVLEDFGDSAALLSKAIDQHF